ENRISTSPGAAAVSDLYYGNDLLCDISEPNCGMGGGGGGGGYWTDNGFGTIYYDSGDVAIGSTFAGARLFVDGDGGLSLSVYDGDAAFDDSVAIGSLTYNGSGNEMLYIERPGQFAHIRFQ